MRILIAEYASAMGIGGTCELEGRAMLSALASSFGMGGHRVIYPTCGPTIGAGRPLIVRRQEEFEEILETVRADAGLLIAPDDMLARFLEILERNTANLGSSPEASRICADKVLCTQRLKRASVPVAEILASSDSCMVGCNRYVIKPRYGCGSEGVRISSSARAPPGSIATRYLEGIHLSASFIVGEEGFLPLTINRQLIEFQGDAISYQGSQVPYNTPRFAEIWEMAEKAALALGLRGYAGIDLVLGDLPWAVDVNARPTTSIIGISRVIEGELGDLILRAKFGGMPKRVNLMGECIFRKEDLSKVLI